MLFTSIHELTQRVWAPPVTEVLRYSVSNAVMLLNGIMFDFYPGLPHTQSMGKFCSCMQLKAIFVSKSYENLCQYYKSRKYPYQYYESRKYLYQYYESHKYTCMTRSIDTDVSTNVWLPCSLRSEITTLCWLRCRLTFSLIWSAIQSLRGARSSQHHAVHSPAAIDLAISESHIIPDF